MNTVKKTHYLSGAFLALVFVTAGLLFGAISVFAADAKRKVTVILSLRDLTAKPSKTGL